MKKILLIVLVLSSSTAEAQQKAADISSYVSLGVLFGLDTKASFDCPNRVHCFKMQAIREGVTIGISEAVKRIVRRKRPCAPSCGIDNPDFDVPSEHTALAFSVIGGPSVSISIPLGVATGVGRRIANKHDWIGVLTGAGLGLVTSRIR